MKFSVYVANNLEETQFLLKFDFTNSSQLETHIPPHLKSRELS